MNNFFKNSDFNFFTNKPSIFFDILRGKELYFSKRYHLSRLEQVFISKSHVKVIATVLGHAVSQSSCIFTNFFVVVCSVERCSFDSVTRRHGAVWLRPHSQFLLSSKKNNKITWKCGRWKLKRIQTCTEETSTSKLI